MCTATVYLKVWAQLFKTLVGGCVCVLGGGRGGGKGVAFYMT